MGRPSSKYAIALVAGGLLLIGGGAALALVGQSPSVPDWADAQIRTPDINVYTDGGNAPLLVLADFTRDSEYVLTILPATDDGTGPEAAALPVGVERRVALVVTASERFRWATDPGLEQVELRATGDETFISAPTGLKEGSASSAHFAGVLRTPGTPMILRLTPSRPFVLRSGPYARVVLPQIGTEPDADIAAAGPASSAEEMKARLDAATTIGTIDGKAYTTSRLAIRATTTPFESFNVDWTLHRTIPAPVGGPPTAWETEQRFAVDLVYRDLAWERQAQQRVVLGGVALGLGTALVTIPLGLRQPTTTVSTRGTRRRRR